MATRTKAVPGAGFTAPFAVLAVALSALAFAAFSTDVADTDFWWHLRTGQYVAETGELPVPDPFSATTASAGEAYEGEARVRHFNLTHEWLAQWFAYVVFAAGGFPALVALRALLLSVVCLAGAWLAWRETGHLLPAAFAGVAPMPVLLLFAADRPAVLTFALVAAFVCVLESYWRKPSRWIWALPVLQCLWMNAHGGAFLGWLVLAIYSVAALGKPARERKLLWTVAAIAFAASALNPNVYAHLPILLAYRQSFLTKTLIEWSRPPLWGPPYVYILLLYSGAAVLGLSWRRVALRHALLFVAFGAASLMAFRNLPLLVFVAGFCIAIYGWPWLGAGFGRLPRLVGWAAPAALLIATAAWRATAAPPALHFGVVDWRFPTAAADLIETLPVDAPLFNTYELGGYLIWRLGPERKVFIDGRALSENVYADYRRMVFGVGDDPAASQLQRTQLLRRYGIRVIVMNGIEFVSGRIYPMFLALADPAGQQWRLIHADEAAVVWVANTYENRPILNAHPALDSTRALDHLEQACQANIEHDPELILCARSLGFLFSRLGLKERGRAAFDLYLSHLPGGDPQVRQARDSLAQ